MSSIIESCVAFKIDHQMVLDLVKQAIIDKNDELLSKMFVDFQKPETLEDICDYEYDIMYGIREKNEEIRNLDYECAEINYFPYNSSGAIDFWEPSGQNATEITYLPIPYSEGLFTPKFSSWKEVIEIVRKNIPWLPSDYDISKHIVLLNATVYI